MYAESGFLSPSPFLSSSLDFFFFFFVSALFLFESPLSPLDSPPYFSDRLSPFSFSFCLCLAPLLFGSNFLGPRAEAKPRGPESPRESQKGYN